MKQWILGSLHKQRIYMCARRRESLVVPSFPSNNVFVFVFVYLCKKRLECATRLSSSGLPSLGDPCRPRWERGPCRSLVELVVPAVPHNQPNKSHQRGLGRRRGIFGLPNFSSQRLSLEYVTARDLNRVARQLLCSHRSHQVGRVTGGKISFFFLFLFNFLFCSDSDRHNAWAFVKAKLVKEQSP